MIPLKAPPVGKLIGFVMKSNEPGHAVFEMNVDERHHNPMGTLHGGIYCDLADAAMGFAYASTLAEGEAFTTIELKINFLRAVRNGILTADAKVVKAGSTLGYIECEVKDQTGTLVAKVASTCMKLRQDRKGGRAQCVGVSASAQCALVVLEPVRRTGGVSTEPQGVKTYAATEVLCKVTVVVCVMPVELLNTKTFHV